MLLCCIKPVHFLINHIYGCIPARRQNLNLHLCPRKKNGTHTSILTEDASFFLNPPQSALLGEIIGASRAQLKTCIFWMLRWSWYISFSEISVIRYAIPNPKPQTDPGSSTMWCGTFCKHFAWAPCIICRLWSNEKLILRSYEHMTMMCNTNTCKKQHKLTSLRNNVCQQPIRSFQTDLLFRTQGSHLTRLNLINKHKKYSPE